MMIIESLNIGFPREENFHGKKIWTGMCKIPASGSIRLGMLGFEGDGVGDTKHHGGPDKAVCVYSIDHYPFWQRVIGCSLPRAPFGENLSVSNLHEDDVCVGDIFEAGTALLQVSQPRQPCKTLLARCARDDMIKLMVETGYTGFYFRVLEEGIVQKGNTLVREKRDPHGITISFANRIYHHDRRNVEAIEKVLAVASLSESWRRYFLELRDRC
jgi:MOSC domain-containing protein YiiM